MANDLTRIARRLANLDRRMSATERSAQSAYRSVESGVIEVNDADGNVIAELGQLADGTFGTVDLVRSVPAAPSVPDADGMASSIAVGWDGGFEDAQPDGVTVAYVGVHLNQDLGDPDWEPTVESEFGQITPGGGALVLPGDAGVETAVHLVTVSAAGVWSAPTGPILATPKYPFDSTWLDGVLANLQTALADAQVQLDGILPITETKIEDGAITTPKIAAGAVTAVEILAGTITGLQIAAGSITANEVAADVMVTNDFYARDGIHVSDGSGAEMGFTPTAGFQQTNSDSSDRINFPVDPSQPNVMRSDLITEGLTSLGRTSFRGADNEFSRNSVTTLTTGTTPPSTSPSVTATHEQATDYDYLAPSIFPWSATPKSMVWTGTAFAMANGSAGQYRLEFHTPGSAPTYQALTLSGAGASLTGAVTGMVRIGTDWYLRIGVEVVKFNASFQYVSKWTPANGAATGVSTDGTYVIVPGLVSQVVTLYRYNTSGTYQSSLTTGLSAGGPVEVLYGSFDYGAARIITRYAGQVYSLNASGVRVPLEDFTLEPKAVALGWDGANFLSLHGPSVFDGVIQSSFFRHSTLRTSRAIDVGYVWYDSDPVGGNYETTLSPIVAVAQPARTYLRVTTPPPADDGTSNAPDSARLYVGTSGGTLRLQGSSFVVSTPALEVDPASGTAAPTTNTFPDGTPAVLRSADGSAFFAGDGAAEFPQLEARVAAEAAAATKAYVDALTAVSVTTLETSVVPNSTSNVTITDLAQTIESPGTSAVYLVTLDALIAIGAASGICRIGVLIDGDEDSAIIDFGGVAAIRGNLSRTWVFTGLSAGNHALTVRTRMTTSVSATVVGAGSTQLLVRRVA